MASSRDDTATLVLAVLLIVLLLAGGVLFVARKAASLRATAAAQQARALEMEAHVRAMAAQAESDARHTDTPAGAPGATDDPNTAQRRSLDQAAAKLQDGSVTDPAAKASMHAVLGQGYFGLGDLDAAQQHFTAALALHVKIGGEDSPDAAADRENLAKVAAARSK